jgi:hypothetical protein
VPAPELIPDPSNSEVQAHDHYGFLDRRGKESNRESVQNAESKGGKRPGSLRELEPIVIVLVEDAGSQG